MNEDEFLKQMETLQVPEVDPALHQQKVKMTIMNAERSAALSVWLLVLPVFLFLFFLNPFNITALNNWMFGIVMNAAFNKSPGGWEPIIWNATIWYALPAASTIVNLLAILNIRYHQLKPTQGKVNELSVTIKLKWWNIILLTVSMALLILVLFDN